MNKATVLEIMFVCVGLMLIIIQRVYVYMRSKASAGTTYVASTRAYQYIDSKATHAATVCMDEANDFLERRAKDKASTVSDAATNLHATMNKAKPTTNT